MSLRVLTVHQPFALAIALADPLRLGDRGKRCENRGWRPPNAVIGEQLAIHASVKSFDEDDALEVGRKLFDNLPDPLRDQYSMRAGEWFGRLAEGKGKVLAVARLAKVVDKKIQLEPVQQKWWVGDFGWVLEDVRMLERPVLCKGMQGLWQLTGTALNEVRMQVPE